MEFRSKQMHTRISAFKARKVADLIRGKKVDDAMAMLEFMTLKASFLFEKMLKSAVANAEQSANPVSLEDLLIKTVCVDEGPTMKRFMFRAQGRVYRIRKRTSHITLVLADSSNQMQSDTKVKQKRDL
jgi:large subunit ribosomal protein L22